MTLSLLLNGDQAKHSYFVSYLSMNPVTPRGPQWMMINLLAFVIDGSYKVLLGDSVPIRVLQTRWYVCWWTRITFDEYIGAVVCLQSFI